MADLFQLNPIRFAEDLATSKEQKSYGNTPRPSSAETFFISAMSNLHSRKYDIALNKLEQAVKVAEEDAVAKPTLSNREALAIIRLEYGFVLWLLKSFDKAIQQYAISFETWEEIHGKENPKLHGILKDYAQLLEQGGKKKESLEIWTRLLEVPK